MWTEVHFSGYGKSWDGLSCRFLPEYNECWESVCGPCGAGDSRLVHVTDAGEDSVCILVSGAHRTHEFCLHNEHGWYSEARSRFWFHLIVASL